MRIHPLAEKGPPSGTPSNCGAPSRARSQSVILRADAHGLLAAVPHRDRLRRDAAGPGLQLDPQGRGFNGDLCGGAAGEEGEQQDQARNGAAHGAESVKTIVCV